MHWNEANSREVGRQDISGYPVNQELTVISINCRNDGHISKRIFTLQLHSISSWSASTMLNSRFCF